MPRLHHRLRRVADRAGRTAVDHGIPAHWLGFRWVRPETVHEHFERLGWAPEAGSFETVHPAATVHNPLPANVGRQEDLPADRGWWGFSFRDVPRRRAGETFLATLHGARVVWYVDADGGGGGGEFRPAVLSADHRPLSLREIRFRPPHGAVLRGSHRPAHRESATWITERVYDNHSHWLTAHLPKLLLLRERGELGDVLLPPKRTPAMDESLRLAGFDPDELDTFDATRPLVADRLTVVETDRFRPELIRLARDAFASFHASAPERLVYVSRARAQRRRLVNEDEVWPILAVAGFERVFMEELSLAEQVQIMAEAAVVWAPHGAGLTNVLFCPRGTQVVEMADLGFPNPNFYALASALGHRYWLISASSRGDAHPLERDMHVSPGAVAQVLDAVLAS